MPTLIASISFTMSLMKSPWIFSWAVAPSMKVVFQRLSAARSCDFSLGSDSQVMMSFGLLTVMTQALPWRSYLRVQVQQACMGDDARHTQPQGRAHR